MSYGQGLLFEADHVHDCDHVSRAGCFLLRSAQESFLWVGTSTSTPPDSYRFSPPLSTAHPPTMRRIKTTIQNLIHIHKRETTEKNVAFNLRLFFCYLS